MANVAVATAATIEVKDGTYDELLYVRGKDNLTIHGQSRAGTVIASQNYDGLNTGSGAGTASPGASAGGGRAVVLVESSDLLVLDNLTLENTFIKLAGASGTQAEVIYFNGNAQRLIAKNVNLISRQDTVQVNGYAWFYNDLIAGDVDFIWGRPRQRSSRAARSARGWTRPLRARVATSFRPVSAPPPTRVMCSSTAR